jgi:uncharacterized protein with FMN-binding domain
VRKVTKNIVGVLSLGVLATSWSLGQAAENGLVVGAPAASEPTSNAEPSASTAPVESPSAASSASASASTSATSGKATTGSTTPTPTATKNSASSSNSQIGTAIGYKYGYIQVEVVKSGSTITAVNLVQAGTRGQEYAAVPGMLADAAVAANGSGFGNVSGATFTTDAFKTALESALAKF